MAWLRRVLSAGVTDALPERLARHLRVMNALALVGVVISVVSIPVDTFGQPIEVVGGDAVCAGVFASCWGLAARGLHTASRVVVGATANAVMLIGVLGAGGQAELRSMLFPLVVLPFLLFDLSERGWLAVLVSVPMVEYFLTAAVPSAAPNTVLGAYMIAAPVLGFALLVAGAIVFAYVERSATDRMLRTRARAEQATRLASLGEMATGIAHEIRNPLAAIQLAATHLVEHSGDPAVVRQLGERIQRIVGRADHIIDTLRAFSRDASGDPFVREPVARVIGDALELCGKQFADRGVELAVPAVADELALECRAVQLSQVLVNLLRNAHDAVAGLPERWVRIDVREPEAGWLELAVTDSGTGIPAAARARLFEPFFTTKGPDRGTGLGLSLSKSIVQSHRGTLELDTAAPNTRFVIRVPRAHRAS